VISWRQQASTAPSRTHPIFSRLEPPRRRTNLSRRAQEHRAEPGCSPRRAWMRAKDSSVATDSTKRATEKERARTLRPLHATSEVLPTCSMLARLFSLKRSTSQSKPATQSECVTHVAEQRRSSSSAARDPVAPFVRSTAGRSKRAVGHRHESPASTRLLPEQRLRSAYDTTQRAPSPGGPSGCEKNVSAGAGALRVGSKLVRV
jgi:hypothetical protein